jgi:hypothetical protein
MPMVRRDDTHVAEVIDHVRLFLSQRLGREVEQTGSPDREDRNTRACDAILRDETTTFAVEHTAVDSFRGQREDDARFRQVLEQLESRLKDQLPHHIDLCIPTHAIVPGRNWGHLADAIHSWLLDHNAEAHDDRWDAATIPGVPFAVHIRWALSAGPGSLFVMRWTVPDHQTQRVEVIVARLMDKAEVLEQYQVQGCRSVLVLESNDTVLVNRYTLHADFKAATETYRPSAIDDVLLIQTGTRPWCITPLWRDGGTVENVQPYWPTVPGYPLAGTQWETCDQGDDP